MPWTSEFSIDHSARTVQLLLESTQGDVSSACTAALSNLVAIAIERDVFSIIHGKHSELYPIVGAAVPISVERFARSLFGITARGAHLTVYTHTNQGIKIWVPRRASTLFTYPDCLDTTVAGGVTSGEDPFNCVIREAAEEASLPESLVRDGACSCGVLSYLGLKNAIGGEESGLVSPDLIYVYDLHVAEDIMLKPQDDEVKEFYLWGVEKVKQELAKGEFKTNSALVMIDFLMRHGFITPANEKDYVEIRMRMHRRLPFPITVNHHFWFNIELIFAIRNIHDRIFKYQMNWNKSIDINIKKIEKFLYNISRCNFDLFCKKICDELNDQM